MKEEKQQQYPPDTPLPAYPFPPKSYLQLKELINVIKSYTKSVVGLIHIW